MDVSIPSYNNDLHAGFVTRFKLEGDVWSAETGTGSSTGELLSNKLDGAPVKVSPTTVNAKDSGPTYQWDSQMTIFKNNFSQQLFHALLWAGTIGPVPVEMWGSVGLNMDTFIEARVSAQVKPFAELGDGGHTVSTDFYLLSDIDLQVPCEARADVLFGVASVAARLIPEANFQLDTHVGMRDTESFDDLYLRATVSLGYELSACVDYLFDESCWRTSDWFFRNRNIISPRGDECIHPDGPAACDPQAKGGPDWLTGNREKNDLIFNVVLSAPEIAISPDGDTTVTIWVDQDGIPRIRINEDDPETMPGVTNEPAEFLDPAAAMLSNSAAMIAWTQYAREEAGIDDPITLDDRNKLAASCEIVVAPLIRTNIAPPRWELQEAFRLTDVPGEVAHEDRRADGMAAIAADTQDNEAIVAWIRYETPDFLVHDQANGGKKMSRIEQFTGDLNNPTSFPRVEVDNIYPQLNMTAIYAQRVGLAGRIGEPVKISPPAGGGTEGINIEPAIAISPSADHACCVWIRDAEHLNLIDSNRGRNIYYAMYDKASGEWSEAQPVMASPDEYPGMLEPSIALKDGRNGLLAFTALPADAAENDTGLFGGGRLVYACRLVNGVFGEPYLVHRECEPVEYGRWVSVDLPVHVEIEENHLHWENGEYYVSWERNGLPGSPEGSGGVMVAALPEGTDIFTHPVNLTPDNNIRSNMATAFSPTGLRALSMNFGPARLDLFKKRTKGAPVLETTRTPLKADPAITAVSLTDQFSGPGTLMSAWVDVKNEGLAGTPMTDDDQSALGLKVELINHEGLAFPWEQIDIPVLAPGESMRLEVPVEMPHEPMMLRFTLDPNPIDADDDDNMREVHLGAARIRNLACDTVVRNDGTDRIAVHLGWENPMAYDEILLYRDGAMIASLKGSCTSFMDLDVSEDVHEYAARGRVGLSKSSRTYCTFEVSNAPPTAVISSSELDDGDWRCDADECTITICPPGRAVNFSSELSHDAEPGQDIASVAWDVDGDGQYDDTTKPMLTLQWDTPGTYEFGLRVTDDFERGPKSATQRITVIVAPCETEFIRGDANVDGKYDLSDAISILDYLFGAGESNVRNCLKAADSNDDGSINLADAIYLLTFLFSQGDDPMPPYKYCGTDPTEDKLTCEAFTICED